MSAKQIPPADTNMTRLFMNTAMEWFVNNGHHRFNFICDATMFDVGPLAPQINPLGQIILNMSANATRGFEYTDEGVQFHCGCNGQDVFLEVPYEAVLGFNVPFGENNMVSLPLPNFERHMLQVELNAAYRELAAIQKKGDFDGDSPVLKEGELPDGAYAVHAPNTDFDGDPNVPNPHDLPTVKDLMHRKPFAERPAPVVKEKPKPLLDFGALPGEKAIIAAPPRPRRVGAPHLTVIQGGKQ